MVLPRLPVPGLALALALLCGCGSLFGHFPRPDAGADAGAEDAGSPRDGGLPDAGGADAGPPDAGGFDGGPDAGPGDAGAPDAGGIVFIDGGPFTWSGNLGSTVPPIDSVYSAVWGSSASDVYVSGSFGLYHWDGAQLSLVFATPGALNGVWESPSGAVVTVDSFSIYTCLAGCTDAGAYTNVLTGPMNGACGTGLDNAWAVGSGSGGSGSVWHLGDAGWTEVPNDAGLLQHYACTALPSGDLFVGGIGAVLHVRASAFDVELAPPLQRTSDYRWFGIFSVDGWVHVAGDGKTVMTRPPDGGWFTSLGGPGPGLLPFRALGGVVNAEVFAAGLYDDAGTHRARFAGGSWAFSGPVVLPNGDAVDVYGMWAADANTYFLVGREWGPGVGVARSALVLGTR